MYFVGGAIYLVCIYYWRLLKIVVMIIYGIEMYAQKIAIPTTIIIDRFRYKIETKTSVHSFVANYVPPRRIV